MPLSQLKDELQRALANFLWIEWGQMGVPANVGRREPRATDPEALLLLTFEVGREEPRLFEEVLDWLVTNERLVSVQRLRNLGADEDDRALVEAVVGWLGQNRRRSRLGARTEFAGGGEPLPFFRGSRLQVADPDPAFLAQGFLKPPNRSSGKSGTPDLALPINFAFRLRLLLGVGVRAEVIRVLLTTDVPKMNAQALAASTAYTKRNVQEAAASLTDAGFVTTWTVGNENQFEASPDRWAEFLGTQLPGSVDWPQIFRAFRRILRWLDEAGDRGLSDYMFSSRARTLVEEIQPDLRFAGLSANTADSTEDVASFKQLVQNLVRNFLSVDL